MPHVKVRGVCVSPLIWGGGGGGCLCEFHKKVYYACEPNVNAEGILKLHGPMTTEKGYYLCA